VPPTIRPSRANDAAFIAALARSVFAEYAKHPVVGRGATLVAASRERALGFVTVDTSRRGWATLVAIAVEPDAQGQGVGRRLLLAAEAHARARGARVLDLCTADANLAALELFLKSGFHITRRLRRYYPRGQNACLLEKDLSLG
jgi:ribosomal protein S18 acetylase RimI-like enzyme